MPRYPAPYPMIRPVFPLRPIPPTGLIPAMPRPPIPGFRGLPPVATPIVRPIVPVVTPIEKPQTTVYVGKISATVENEFLLSILTLCGPVKSWKRAQDPSDGTPKAFGFCEFESAEGVLRSLRLLSKLNIDGQELMLNINQATREYLERYVERKAEKEKQKEVETGDPANERDSKESTEKQEQFPRPIEEGTNKDSADKENQVGNKSFGLVTDEDREFDAVALEKLTGMIEERLKNKPLPPPMLVDGSVKCTSDTPSKSKDGDSDADIMKSDAAEEKNDDDTMSENKPTTESDKPETPDRSKRHDNRSRERDRERDLKREKERELERVERERERERVRRERDREMKLREAERLYKDRLKEWEAREREKEYQRQYEKEREKERDRERWKEIMRQEDESSGDDDDDSRKRRRRTSLLEEKRKKRQHEKEEDFEDRLKEKEQIAEAKRRATEEQVKLETKQLKLESKSLDQVIHEDENAMQEDENFERKQIASSHANDVLRNDLDDADGIYRNSSGDDLNMMAPIAVSDKKQNAPARKLGFGLIGSGKRTTVPSVFHEEDDEDLDEKKMRPLVPIDYSTEELQAVQANASGSQPNLVAAAEFAKRISGVNPKDEKADINRERSRRSSDKQNLRDRDRNDDESSRSKDESREKMHDRNIDREKSREDKPKTENKKLFDAKQLIDMIPKTKEELFVYEINWDVYDKHHLHERMRPWISKKITEFLGEEEATLVDYIVSCIKDHVQASTMLEMLQSILDDEAEMFVLKMWRMLIFEIKKVETGLSMKSKS